MCTYISDEARSNVLAWSYLCTAQCTPEVWLSFESAMILQWQRIFVCRLTIREVGVSTPDFLYHKSQKHLMHICRCKKVEAHGFVSPNHLHLSLDVLLRKIPMARGSSVRVALLVKRGTRLHTWQPCPRTAAVYKSHGHIAACVGKGAQFQLDLSGICVESVVLPDKIESFALSCESGMV